MQASKIQIVLLFVRISLLLQIFLNLGDVIGAAAALPPQPELGATGCGPSV